MGSHGLLWPPSTKIRRLGKSIKFNTSVCPHTVTILDITWVAWRLKSYKFIVLNRILQGYFAGAWAVMQWHNALSEIYDSMSNRPQWLSGCSFCSLNTSTFAGRNKWPIFCSWQFWINLSNETISILIEISAISVHNSPISNNATLLQGKIWYPVGEEALTLGMVTQSTSEYVGYEAFLCLAVTLLWNFILHYSTV